MSYLYVTENGVSLSLEANCIKVKEQGGCLSSIPIETLESISIFSKAQVTTQCIIECMKRGIPISYYSYGGHYLGKIESMNHIHVDRQRKQDRLYDTEFALDLGKGILCAKIKNQETILRRYARNKKTDLTEETKMMNIFMERSKKAYRILK